MYACSINKCMHQKMEYVAATQQLIACIKRKGCPTTHFMHQRDLVVIVQQKLFTCVSISSIRLLMMYSFEALHATIYFASVEDRGSKFCLQLADAVGPPAAKKMCPTWIFCRHYPCPSHSVY
ncbi:hypothetical protein O6H91_12G061500 [Diphasiastrum complanatum]|uniref:Uncharacterized protein n=2 Tax=Diphasiastrum complanatum TaxID=34168 RepID=A0ACC2C2J7_DIPCM|nr:hypothetical protein O6H91_12G061500 [Diphasiastrum complanatum]KAJ7536239.1 hypothetical protein O6H91_12G061500 [Diphasiastrum complanatum]